MDVRCDKCGTEYEFDENRISANGVTVKCTACGFVFKVRRPRVPPPRATTTIGKGPQGGKEWLVRKPDGQMIAFRELTTLQKWIVEGRIARDDEISKNGETWKRLGNIMELEPFFSVYEKARTLNTLMDQSQVELRGSEVLSAANPIPQPQPLPPSIPTIPPQYSSSVSLPTAAASSVPAVRGAMPLPENTQPLPLTRSEPPPPAPGNGMGAHGAASANTAPARPAPPLNHRLQPAAIPDLSIPIDDGRVDTSKSDIVGRFQRSQRRKAVGWVLLLLVLLGAGGGVALAVYGPEGNPLKGMAIQYGLLTARPVDDGAMRLVEEAQSAADLDTLASLQKAAALLEKAQTIRDGDPMIAGERSLVLTMQAGAYRRWAKDLEATGSPVEVQEKLDLAATLLAEALSVATAAERHAPDAFEPARALAAHHLIEKDAEAYARSLEKAKAGMEKAGRVDPATLYLEATAALKDPASPDPEGLDPAKALLEQAVTARPTMNAARVLLARIHLAKEAPPSAKVELDRVLQTAPAHEEAKRLAAATAELEKTLAAKQAPPPPPPPQKRAKPDPDAPEAGHPDTFEWWMARADSLRERDRTVAALKAYDRAADLRPASAEPHTGRGWCYLDLDRPQLALTAFDRAIHVNNRFAMAYYGMAEAHRALGDKNKAIEAYEEFLSRAPPNSPDRATAARTLARLKAQ